MHGPRVPRECGAISGLNDDMQSRSIVIICMDKIPNIPIITQYSDVVDWRSILHNTLNHCPKH